MRLEMNADATAPLAERSGSAVCHWIISPPGWEYRECGRPATQYDPDATVALCDSHAEEYAQVFGWERLRSINPNATDSPTGADTTSK